MSSARDCIEMKGLVGKMRAQEIHETLDLFDKIKAPLLEKMDAASADIEAGLQLQKLLRDRAELHRYQAGLQIVKSKQNLDAISAHTRGVKNGALGLLDRDIYDEMGAVKNVEALHWGIVGDTHRVLNEAIEKHRTKAFDFGGDVESQKDWLFGLFNDSRAGAEGKAFADSYRQALDQINTRFRKAGGVLPDHDGVYLPNPKHDFRSIGNIGRDAWVKTTLPLLDRTRMLDFDTKQPLNDMQILNVLNEAWETLSTDGLNKLDGTKRGKAKVANRRQRPRILEFKDADSWQSYNEQFGDKDIFATLMGHIDGMSRDTALMDVMGPDPEGAMNQFAALIRQEGGIASESGARHFEKTYAIAAGQDGVVGKGYLHGGFQTMRAWLTGQQLGSATITALSDFGFIKKTAEFNGLSATKVMANYVKLMNPKNPAHRKAAAKMSIVVENALSAAHAQSRFVDSIGTSRFAGKYADFIMRASGLSPHTQAGRSAFGMTVYGELADNAQKSFKDMDQDFARMLTRYGIDADGWDILRSADLMDHAGHQYMTPADVAGINHPRAVELATKLKQAVFSEMNFAVPTGTARVEGLLSFGTDKGTLVGELTRTFMMYKRFPVLVMQSHLTRSLFSPEGSWVSKDGKFNRGVYIAKLTIYTSVMGALAVQLSDISNGKDPRDMTDPKFWGAAVLKGGAMGFFGDFMYSGLYGQNRYGQSMLGSMAGPGASFVGDTLKLTLGQLGAASIGEDANFGRAATDYFERYLMPGTSLWYSKLAQDRLIADQLKKAADPKYNKRIRMIENRALKERGQKYWWKAGDVAPERTPDLKKAGGS